jgi:tRNA-dihydrouridine synthase B
MKWKLKDVQIDNQVLLAPMSGVCDSSFRTIIKTMGCGLVSSEMISTNAVKYGSKKNR